MMSPHCVFERKVLGAGKILSTIAWPWEQAQSLYQRGYQMLMLMADGAALAALASEKVRKFKEHY